MASKLPDEVRIARAKARKKLENKRYRQKHAARLNAAQKARVAAEPEKYKAIYKKARDKHYASNKEAICAKTREYAKANLTMRQVWAREWKLKNPEKYRAQCDRWNAKRRLVRRMNPSTRTRIEKQVGEAMRNALMENELYNTIKAAVPRYVVPHAVDDVIHTVFIEMFEGVTSMDNIPKRTKAVASGTWSRDVSLDATMYSDGGKTYIENVTEMVWA